MAGTIKDANQPVGMWGRSGAKVSSDPTVNAKGTPALVIYALWCHAFTKSPKQPLSILHELDVGL